MVSGKIINVFSENDYTLAFTYRTTSIQLGIAGLQEIRDVPGVDNFDPSAEVSGHLRYPDLIGQILVRIGFSGIEVEDASIERDIIVDETGKIHLVDGELDTGMGELRMIDNDMQEEIVEAGQAKPEEDGKAKKNYVEPKSMANDSRLRQSQIETPGHGELHLVEAKPEPEPEEDDGIL